MGTLTLFLSRRRELGRWIPPFPVRGLREYLTQGKVDGRAPATETARSCRKLSGQAVSFVTHLENGTSGASSLERRWGVTLFMHDSSRDSFGVPGGPDGGPDGGGKRAALSKAERDFARELFERHRLSLYRYLNNLLHSREEARDILQETYLRLLRQPSFEHVRKNARAYLFQIATNLARDLFRRRAVKGIDTEMEAFAAGGTPDWMSWPEFALEAEQIAAVVLAALRDLERPVRSALLLHRFRGMTHGQIAVRLSVSERTIDRYIKKGLCAIAKRLEAEL